MVFLFNVKNYLFPGRLILCRRVLWRRTEKLTFLGFFRAAILKKKNPGAAFGRGFFPKYLSEQFVFFTVAKPVRLPVFW